MARPVVPDPEKERLTLIASHLQRLLATQEWEVFKEHVEEMEKSQISTLVSATADWRYIQGRIEGIREALRLPLLLIARARRP